MCVYIAFIEMVYDLMDMIVVIWEVNFSGVVI
ncbi:hypothetical protein BAN_0900002 [Borrelia anserina BA2]|uniref:Uncharacterized protein n=1 Tax=Borrelia anserina BA2 TaxID=1313293 RepID=W5SNJ7_BORAN|nr:hypothetical protein BAN_0900002 [Borrelia anserina BA2]